MLSTPFVIRRAVDADGAAIGRLGALLVRAHFAFDPLRFLAPGSDPEAGYGRFLTDQLREAGVPGVDVRGGVSSLPFTSSVGWGSINVEGFTPAPGQELQVDQRGATADYFRTMQIPLVTGRFFTDVDSNADAQSVAIVDEKFAQRFWPNVDPIGKTVWFDPKRRHTIVGVVGTVKQYGLDIDGRIVVYLPAGGLPRYQVARTSSNPSTLANAIVRAIQNVDPTMPVYDVRTMPDRMRDSMARQRFSTIMLGAFAGFALILAGVGIDGVMSYLVTQGTSDIGVHVALGAPVIVPLILTAIADPLHPGAACHAGGPEGRAAAGLARRARSPDGAGPANRRGARGPTGGRLARRNSCPSDGDAANPR